MDEKWRTAQLDALWDAYVLKIYGPDEQNEERNRSHKALEVLGLLRTLYEEGLDRDDEVVSVMAPAQGRVVQQLLSLEFGEWLLGGLDLGRSIMRPDEWIGLERIALRSILTMHEKAGPPTHRPVLDPMLILMPRWIAQRLADALDALDHGEVQDLLRPKTVGRHNDTWSWDQMRARALEHVAHLRGQDYQAQVAQRRVAVAMKVSPETLRSWDKVPSLKAGCELALQAGQLKTLLDDDPDYARRGDNSVDGAALARLRDFRTEPLSAFGQLYHDRFGSRHNQDTAGGD